MVQKLFHFEWNDCFWGIHNLTFLHLFFSIQIMITHLFFDESRKNWWPKCRVFQVASFFLSFRVAHIFPWDLPTCLTTLFFPNYLSNNPFKLAKLRYSSYISPNHTESKRVSTTLRRIHFLVACYATMSLFLVGPSVGPSITKLF